MGLGIDSVAQKVQDHFYLAGGLPAMMSATDEIQSNDAYVPPQGEDRTAEKPELPNYSGLRLRIFFFEQVKNFEKAAELRLEIAMDIIKRAKDATHGLFGQFIELAFKEIDVAAGYFGYHGDIKGASAIYEQMKRHIELLYSEKTYEYIYNPIKKEVLSRLANTYGRWEDVLSNTLTSESTAKEIRELADVVVRKNDFLLQLQKLDENIPSKDRQDIFLKAEKSYRFAASLYLKADAADAAFLAYYEAAEAIRALLYSPGVESQSLGLLEIMEKDYRDALHYRYLTLAQKYLPMIYENRLNAWLDHGDPSLADASPITGCVDAMEREKIGRIDYNKVIDFLFKAEQYDDVIRYGEKYLEKERGVGESVRLFGILSLSHLAEGNIEAAKEYVEKVGKMAPNSLSEMVAIYDFVDGLGKYGHYKEQLAMASEYVLDGRLESISSKLYKMAACAMINLGHPHEDVMVALTLIIHHTPYHTPTGGLNYPFLSRLKRNFLDVIAEYEKRGEKDNMIKVLFFLQDKSATIFAKKMLLDERVQDFKWSFAKKLIPLLVEEGRFTEAFDLYAGFVQDFYVCGIRLVQDDKRIEEVRPYITRAAVGMLKKAAEFERSGDGVNAVDVYEKIARFYGRWIHYMDPIEQKDAWTISEIAVMRGRYMRAIMATQGHIWEGSATAINLSRGEYAYYMAVLRTLNKSAAFKQMSIMEQVNAIDRLLQECKQSGLRLDLWLGDLDSVRLEGLLKKDYSPTIVDMTGARSERSVDELIKDLYRPEKK